MTRSTQPGDVPAVTPETVFIISRDQVSCQIEGETVLLSLKNAVYYGLDPIATRIWELFRNGLTVGGACESLVAEYDVDPAVCLTDTMALCTQLTRWGLLEVVASADIHVPHAAR